MLWAYLLKILHVRMSFIGTIFWSKIPIVESTVSNPTVVEVPRVSCWTACLEPRVHESSCRVWGVLLCVWKSLKGASLRLQSELNTKSLCFRAIMSQREHELRCLLTKERKRKNARGSHNITPRMSKEQMRNIRDSQVEEMAQWVEALAMPPWGSEFAFSTSM